MHWRSRLPALAGAAAGVAVAAVLTLLQSSTYQADASIVLVRQGQPPGSDPALAQAADAAAGLFHSRAVAEPALANLRLEESADELLDRFSVETEPESSLVRISVEAPSRDEARRTAQELTELSTVLFNDRFGPETVASVWEAPRAQEDRVSPKPVRNLALGALLGALLGSLVGWGLAALGRGRPKPAVSKEPRPVKPKPAVKLPHVKLPHVTLPRPKPKPATQAQVAPPAPVIEPAPDLCPSRSRRHPYPCRSRSPRARSCRLASATGRCATSSACSHEQGEAFPDRTEELHIYLDSFRSVADADGRLPGGVEGVMEDVFRDLIERAKLSPPG